MTPSNPIARFGKIAIRRRTAAKRMALAVAIGLCCAAQVPAGTVVTDGSVGARTTLTGPTYNIPASLGQQKGGNLFHSFSSFSLSKNDVASFSGPTSVTNVIARVTGGASNIDGTVQCTIAGANFYLINPAGVVFGPDSALDVKGAFVVTTADYLKLADGSHFNATNLADTTLTSAAPSAFGFLAVKPAAISTTMSQLTNASGAISIVGGDVQINGGVIQSPGGRVNLVSAASSGELTFDAASLLATIDLTPGGPTLGDVSLQQATIATSGPGGGRISVRGGSLEVNASVLVAQNTGTTPGQGIDIAVSGAAAFSPAIVSTSTSGAGSAGEIDVTAASVAIDGSSLPAVATGISSSTGGTGQAGAMNFNVGSFTLSGGSLVFSGTTAAGNGGNVTINATGDVHVDGTNFPSTAILAATSGTGRAGNIAVTAGTLELSAGGTLSTSTLGVGNAGNISVSANSVSIDNTAGTLANRGMIAISAASGNSGNAGQITVNTGAASVTNGAAISASSSGTGDAGLITVGGGTVTLDEGTSPGITGILSASIGTTGGAAGTISISGTTVQLLNGAVILANNAGTNAAGSITVHATDLTLNDNGLTTVPFGNTGFFADTISASSIAPGGRISISANTVSVLAGGEIAADAINGGNAGTVAIDAAQSLTLDGKGLGVLTGLSAESLAGAGNSGTVQITAPTASILGGAAITVGAFATGAAGNVSVAASQSFTLDGQNLGQGTGIFADTMDGPGANVKIIGGNFSVLGGAQISAGTFGAGTGGNISINVNSMNVQGSSTFETEVVASAFGTGNAGTINVATAGALTLTGTSAITSETASTANAGTLNISAGSLTLDGTGGIASIDAATTGAGMGGVLNINTGAMQILNGSTVNASTLGSGNGGIVNVTATTLDIDRGTSTASTGILSESVFVSGTTNPGAGGTVNVHAGSLIVDNNALIDTTTFGAGAAGGINVTADSIILRNGGSITSNTQDQGPAGNISINAGSLQILNSSQVTSDTLSGAAGGKVMVTVSGALTIDGQAFTGTSATGITAASNGQGGNAGDVSVQAGSLTLLNHGTIESDSEGGSGSAGKVGVSANTINIKSNATISSGTFGDGSSGDVTVSAKQLVIDAENAAHFTGITAQTDGAGNAGAIHISAKSTRLINGGEIDSTTFATGAGGSVFLTGEKLAMENTGVIDSASTVTGAAGTVNIHLTGGLLMTHKSLITSQSLQVGGGGISVFADRSVDLFGSKITTKAGGQGGTVNIVSPGVIDLRNSRILTEAGDNGGNMLVDPSFVILEDSHLSANGGNNGGNITIHPVWLLESQSTITATGMRGVGGTLQVTPDYNLTGALLSLPTSLSDNLTLQPECAADLPGAISSFVVTGRGAAPLQPDGWSADLDLRLPATRPK